MNKKLLFGIMSLAALAACTNDDFDSQQQIAEGTSPIQFEVINNNASMRASMDGTSIKWSAEDGDLFTLYHGVTGFTAPSALTGYENATYTASKGEGGAVLSTPSMIKPGRAIMVWPVDTTFYSDGTGNLTIKIPEILEAKTKENKDGGVENHIPYVSDLITIDVYNPGGDGSKIGNQNTAGLARKYPVYMRPMASQLILHADYAETDAPLKTLAEGEDGIDPIKLTSVDLLTKTGGGTTDFTKEIELQFKEPTSYSPAINWPAKSVLNHNWTEVTDFNLGTAVGVDKLTTKCITGTESAKFLILPQGPITVAAATDGVANAAVVVNTTYGKVVIEKETGATHGGKYSDEEIADAWYRYQATGKTPVALETETTTKKGGSGKDANDVRYTNNIALGLAQVINAFSTNKTTKDGSIVKGEPTGAVGNRYVKVLLTHLDMTDLHIKSDKQLRDVVRVWKEMGLPSVTVYLDGDDPTDDAGKFTISQKTIKKINEINAAVASAGKAFTVMPCQTPKEVCKEIVITGADTDANLQDIAFIKKNGAATAKVVLANETTAWKWNGTTATTKKVLVGEGVERIINKGTMLNDASATLATWSVTYAPTTNVMTAGAQSDIKLQNDGTWNITAGTLRVQSDVVNYGTVNIAAGAEYLQDGNEYLFTNQAKTLPKRITKADTETIGKVNNSGVFATLNDGKINNYGLIEHLTKSAKTYITRNEIGGTDFSTPFAFNTKAMGRINLTYDNKDEDNISISAAAAQGFVSITITKENGEKDLKTSLVENSFVNYIIVNGGVEQISALPTKIKYVEINQPGTEMVWNLSAAATYEGLIVLSPVNVKLGQTITINKATYIGAKMYVGGTFTKGSWSGYYGDTTDNSTTMYVTY